MNIFSLVQMIVWGGLVLLGIKKEMESHKLSRIIAIGISLLFFGLAAYSDLYVEFLWSQMFVWAYFSFSIVKDTIKDNSINIITFVKKLFINSNYYWGVTRFILGLSTILSIWSGWLIILEQIK